MENNNNSTLKFVNKILAKKGIPQVTNLAKDFSDGSKFSKN